MTHAGRRMPLPAKVDTLDAKVCREQKLRSAWHLQYGAVIANTANDATIPAVTNKTADPLDELSLRQQAT